jgi:8-oxo-dGTP pyrophosphatase MutT (NUDIX family)
MADRAREFAAAGLRPAVPRDAATVILVRPETGPESGPETETAGVEVYLLLRTEALEFAPGACVFPGGSVDARDADPGIAETGWAGPAAADFGDLLGVPADRARALVCAAVRETFEESGVLLAGPSPAELVPDSADLARDRRALLDGSLSLSELLSRRGLLLRADLLTPWARWITPEGEPRRFDARFFAAALPAGQVATGHAAESDRIAWLRPADAIESARAGEISLLPPTATTLHDFAMADGAVADGAVADGDGREDAVIEILGRRPVIEPIVPRLVLEDGQAWLYVPDEVGYPL